MPSVSKAQRRFFGAELRRKREGKKTKTGMSAKQLKDFAATSEKGLPKRKATKAIFGRRKKKRG